MDQTPTQHTYIYIFAMLLNGERQTYINRSVVRIIIIDTLCCAREIYVCEIDGYLRYELANWHDPHLWTQMRQMAWKFYMVWAQSVQVRMSIETINLWNFRVCGKGPLRCPCVPAINPLRHVRNIETQSKPSLNIRQYIYMYK